MKEQTDEVMNSSAASDVYKRQIWVKGGIRIEGADGRSYEIRNRVTLCRCGQSSNKPFCDGTHVSMHFCDNIPLEKGKGEW